MEGKWGGYGGSFGIYMGFMERKCGGYVPMFVFFPLECKFKVLGFMEGKWGGDGGFSTGKFQPFLGF